MPARGVLALWAAAAVAAGPGPASGDSDDAYKVVVHPDTHEGDIDRDALRDVFLKKATEWGDHAAHPIQLAARYRASERFDHEVLHKTSSQLKSYWNQQIFSGKGVPPPEADSAADVITYVVSHPGAIGYVPADFDAGRAKVIRVR